MSGAEARDAWRAGKFFRENDRARRARLSHRCVLFGLHARGSSRGCALFLLADALRL